MSGWVKATHEPYTQFYTVDVAETDPSLKVGGAQDNGCNRGYNGVGGPWNAIGCGDGLQVIIHPSIRTSSSGAASTAPATARRTAAAPRARPSAPARPPRSGATG